jgi:hypothetical protein
MINYGSIERPDVPPRTIPPRFNVKKYRKQKYRERKIAMRIQLGLCVTCGRPQGSRFKNCLKCRLGRKVAA